jgi:hypothetical protein
MPRLMDHLEARFGRYLSTAIGFRREKRFARTKDARLLAMAKTSLQRFVPCHTPHSIPENCGRTAPEIFNYTARLTENIASSCCGCTAPSVPFVCPG